MTIKRKNRSYSGQIIFEWEYGENSELIDVVVKYTIYAHIAATQNSPAEGGDIEITPLNSRLALMIEQNCQLRTDIINLCRDDATYHCEEGEE